MFSPYYAWGQRRRPLDHVAMNVALYSRRGARWAMTERRETALHRTPTDLAIGPSSLAWDRDAARYTIDERAAPIPRRVRGAVTVHPLALTGRAFALDECARHVWQPIAPRARVEVAFTDPACAWGGWGYFDTNAGTEPLEAGFAHWDWSRAHLADDTAILYDGLRRDGSRFAHALRIDRAGDVADFEPPVAFDLPRTLWGVPRRTRADAGPAPRVTRTFEDTPFYARATLHTRLLGESATAVHETLSLDRLARPIVRAMLPFRMPRTLR